MAHVAQCTHAGSHILAFGMFSKAVTPHKSAQAKEPQTLCAQHACGALVKCVMPAC